jgi:hypothetical protein
MRQIIKLGRDEIKEVRAISVGCDWRAHRPRGRNRSRPDSRLKRQVWRRPRSWKVRRRSVRCVVWSSDRRPGGTGHQENLRSALVSSSEASVFHH